jgi:uncharacterized protein (TIGR02594 family)
VTGQKTFTHEATMRYSTLDIQRALFAAGFNPGPQDGIPGALTRMAVIRFQKAHGLAPDGIVGPKTAAKLFPSAPASERRDAVPGSLPWMVIAESLRGLKEAPGSANNPVILDWAADLKLPYRDDSVPWCGLFVAHCFSQALPDEPQPTNPLGARNWLRFGMKVAPQFGAALIFWRGSRNGWQGHVGFYWAEDEEAYHVLGGNQSDSVSIARIAKARLLDATWPKSVQPAGIIRTARGGTLLSTNEA